MSWDNKLAYGISVVLHPMLLATMLYLLIYLFAPDIYEPLQDRLGLYLAGIVFVTTFVIPGLSLLFLSMAGVIKDLHLKNRNERFLPLFFVAVLYGTTTFFLARKHLNEIFIDLLSTATLLILSVSLISLFRKISAHATGMAALTGIFIVLKWTYPPAPLLIPTCLSAVAAGLVMSARLKLEAHTPSQVWSGCLLGLLVGGLALKGFLAL